MYTNPVGGIAAGVGVAGIGVLAATGFNVILMLMAGFALIGAGMAVLRILPKGKNRVDNNRPG